MSVGGEVWILHAEGEEFKFPSRMQALVERNRLLDVEPDCGAYVTGPDGWRCPHAPKVYYGVDMAKEDYNDPEAPNWLPVPGNVLRMINEAIPYLQECVGHALTKQRKAAIADLVRRMTDVVQ